MSGSKKTIVWKWVRDRRQARRGAEVRNQVIVQHGALSDTQSRGRRPFSTKQRLWAGT